MRMWVHLFVRLDADSIRTQGDWGQSPLPGGGCGRTGLFVLRVRGRASGGASHRLALLRRSTFSVQRSTFRATRGARLPRRAHVLFPCFELLLEAGGDVRVLWVSEQIVRLAGVLLHVEEPLLQRGAFLVGDVLHRAIAGRTPGAVGAAPAPEEGTLRRRFACGDRCQDVDAVETRAPVRHKRHSRYPRDGYRQVEQRGRVRVFGAGLQPARPADDCGDTNAALEGGALDVPERIRAL